MQNVFLHILIFNNETTIDNCITSALNQADFSLNKNIFITVTDNASTDGSVEKITPFKDKGVNVVLNQSNLGFCGGQNQALGSFLNSNCDYFLMINPDLALESQAVSHLLESFQADKSIGAVCPKLIRANELLHPLEPRVIDAAGMYLTSSLRHFDRGSGEVDQNQFEKPAWVFGGSGACLMLSRTFVESLCLVNSQYESDVDKIYPQLKIDREKRALLFDEAFFAYREDADLAWRAQLYGWKYFYQPKAVAYHVRRVTSQNRAVLPKELNYLGVRNRFLLQLNQYTLAYGLKTFFLGYFLRNILVILGVIIKERSSLRAFRDLLLLFRRGLERRRIIYKNSKLKAKDLKIWLNTDAIYEKIDE